MNHWILWLIKSVCGVVLRDSILIIDEEWNRGELWKKSTWKMVNSAISGQIRKPVLVPLWNGTSIADAVAKRYRYRSKSVPIPVPPSITESVPVLVKAIPIPMAPVAPVFVIFAYLS